MEKQVGIRKRKNKETVRMMRKKDAIAAYRFQMAVKNKGK